MNKSRWIQLIIIIPVLGACVSPATVQTIPEVGIPQELLNNDIYLSAPLGWNNFKTREPIAINIQVISEKIVVFQPDFGVRIFLEDDDKWDEIFDNTIYPEGLIYLSSEDSRSDSSGIVLYPEPLDRTKPANLRVYIIGNIYSNGKITDQLVGSYIDINLKP